MVGTEKTREGSGGILRFFLAEPPEDNRIINDRQSRPGMLLFPFGNLLHTSTLYLSAHWSADIINQWLDYLSRIISNKIQLAD
jgi:hypothetical protein